MLSDLLKNNRAWAVGKQMADPTFFRRLSEQQTPDYLWVGCSDSRVPANEIVGLDPGESVDADAAVGWICGDG